MKIYLNAMFALCFVSISLTIKAQDAVSVPDLIKQGQELNQQKNYAGAIEKYKSALKLEPENARVNYEMAFALYSSGKGAEGVPYLEKAIKTGTNAQLSAGAYSLLGSIYSGANQFQKSITAYTNGIKADSANQRLYYNLGIAQYRAKQYSNAEQSFISALKLDSSYAASQRMYALVTFHQNKRAEALLGFCRFLMLEPNTAQSAEAFGNLQNILSGGSLKPEPGYKPSPATKAIADNQNKVLAKALSSFMSRRYASPGDLLTTQLKAVFTALGTMPNNKYYFADYFYKLSQTEHLPTFARLISQKAYPENAKWLKENAEKVTALENWMKDNKPVF
ncbi:tetratricopeptide repeat protein [Mucilaginibacter sp.]|jgi:tetratricopeptide (TPR) repeat protein|uniref:tetratricopeptide repeat protein n=1 Tax=Mucilaginibacter sp. TaxID=1882438 RepID=UPI003568A006